MLKFFFTFFALLTPVAVQAQRASVEDLVHPRNGTMSEGQTYPAVGMPFGMTSWTPQTRAGETKCVAPYYFTDSRIQGIRASHFLSGSCVPDYGSITLMAGTGPLVTEAVARSSSFDRSSEKPTPYRYSVDLRDAHALVTVAGTSRAGILRFVFTQDASDAWAVLENNSRAGEGWVNLDPSQNVLTAEVPVRREYAGAGKPAGISVFYYAEVDRKPASFGTYIGAGTAADHTRQEGDGAAPGVIRVAATSNAAGGSSAAAAQLRASAPRPGFGLYLRFGPVHKGDTLTLRVGSSFTSVQEAHRNLTTEISTWNLDQVAAAARAEWHRRLASITIAGNDHAQAIFYTAMYHAMLQPRTISDASGSYPRFHDHGQPEHLTAGLTQFDDMSVWDIFRAQAPLMMILDPQLESQVVRSIISKGEQGGFLPIFPAWNSYTSEMVGDHSAVIIADAWSKNIRSGYDIDSAYRLIRKNATELPASQEEYIDGKGRRGLESYLNYGYIPLEDHVPEAFHKDEQVSRTLEYAFDDAIIADLARTQHHPDDAALFAKRGENWRTVFNPATGFVSARHEDGTWIASFDPTKHQPWITEGTPWQYSFFVPQNIPGLITAMGGREAFLARLDQFFSKGYDDHGNEPGHHTPYLFTEAGAPAKTQATVRSILESQYKDTPDGLAGNDDAGQMSAWYIMSALGFYQVCPGRPVYTFGAPRFEDITVHLPNNRTLRILAPGAEHGLIYARSVSLNGTPLRDWHIMHEQLMRGGTLRFDMTDTQPAQ